MTLSEYYKKATLYPSVIVILMTIAFSIIDNYNYKSEWMTAGSVILLSIVTSFVYCSIISLLSATIFLNKFAKIKENIVLSFLTWFLLPFGFITIVIVHEINFKIKYNEKFGNNFMYVVILNLPFIIGLIWTYNKYRKTKYRQYGISAIAAEE